MQGGLGRAPEGPIRRKERERGGRGRRRIQTDTERLYIYIYISIYIIYIYILSIRIDRWKNGWRDRDGSMGDREIEIER